MSYATCKSCGAIPETITDYKKLEQYKECEYCGMKLSAININYEVYEEFMDLSYSIGLHYFQFVKIFGMDIFVVSD